ncbi:ArsR family transcriptional regulator [Maridesulfovibrio sp.]|uniref:VpaChn25_0724 family phage protein n=1 Tax=Maridesulfovibrio sp. TaxID=2795000 RepID=UPI0029CA0BEB|nr:ArsR family transcriptional regulator [Maridesulfovibrio sp.]
MNKRYEQFELENLRSCVLRTLEETPSGTMNESLLDSIAHGAYGFDSNRKRMVRVLRWLEEKGLVTLESFNENCLVAEITAAGARVAQGVEVFPGVKRPERKA